MAERRAARAVRPFPGPLRRARSLLGLGAMVVALGVLTAAVIGACLVALVLVGSHLVG